MIKGRLVLIGLIAGVILLGGGALWWATATSSKGQISAGSLSDRSQAFIEEQSKQERVSDQLVIRDSVNTAGIDISIEDCLELQLDWPARRVKEGNDQTACFVRIELEKPRALLTMSRKKSTSLSEHSGIHLRETSADYEPVSFQHESYPNMSQYSHANGLDTFLEHDTDVFAVIFSETQADTKTLQALVADLLDELSLFD